jgi:NAD(P)-dependent dehydrogenase (short-subunit alcohol dehydrogenase family)
VRQLEDKIVVITGGAGGIGTALARAFAARGSKLALLDIDAEALAGVAEQLRGEGAELSTHQVDVRDRSSLERARDELCAEHGGVDVLVNNAGLTVFSSFEQMLDEEIDRQLGVNLRGVIDGCRVFLPALRARGQGHIVNMSSSAGIAGLPWQTLYSTTKFAVRGFSGALRSELVGEGIGVTCVLPGGTRTPILANAVSRNPAITGALSQQLLARGFPPAWLARRVVRAVRRNRPELVASPDGVLLHVGMRVAPNLVRGGLRALVWSARRRGMRASSSDEDRR